MIPATTNFNSKVDDGVTPQNFIISFDAGLTLSSENGDFTSHGITIMRELGCGDDYSFGSFPSSVLSFSAYNYNNRFNNFAWGQCTVSVECDGETVPIGIFNVEKPAKVMTEIVNVKDAYDNAKKLDIEITEHMRSITYPIAIKDLFYSVLTYCGIGYHTFPTNCLNADYSVIENPLGEIGACSARKMLKWIGEFCLLNFRIAEDGKVRYQNASSSTTSYKTYGDTKIANGGYEIAEFSTAHPDKLIVKNAAGLSYVDGYGDNIYSIISNPWNQDLTLISLSDISDKCPVYHPATYSVIEADPCIECGDLISFTLNGITNTMPIMSQTIVFAGRKTSAIYGSTGNAIRSNDKSIENLDYSMNVANNTGNIIKAIYAKGIDANYITVNNELLPQILADVNKRVEYSEALSQEVKDSVSEEIGKLDSKIDKNKEEIVQTTESLIEDYKKQILKDSNGVFSQMKVDTNGVHIFYVDPSSEDVGEINLNGSEILFKINGIQKSKITSNGFHFDYGILTTALQIGNINENGGEWVWTKSPTGHFRLVHRG